MARLTEICGEKDAHAIPQDKSHSKLYEKDGKLYIAIHVGYYEMIGGIERIPVNAPEGISFIGRGTLSLTRFPRVSSRMLLSQPVERAYNNWLGYKTPTDLSYSMARWRYYSL